MMAGEAGDKLMLVTMKAREEEVSPRKRVRFRVVRDLGGVAPGCEERAA